MSGHLVQAFFFNKLILSIYFSLVNVASFFLSSPCVWAWCACVFECVYLHIYGEEVHACEGPRLT